VLRRHRFTNCYRAADRVSQYLIGRVLYQGSQDWPEVFFRTLIFKIFNRVSTWELLSRQMGEVRWDDYDHRAYNTALTAALEDGQRLYSPAYVMPSPPLGSPRKHTNHLLLVEQMMATRAPERIAEAATMRQAFEILRSYPGLGSFLAYQYLIDLNYSARLTFDEMDFVVPGPGALDGIRKCFGKAVDGIETGVIRYMADTQELHFDRLGLHFAGLRGRRLHLIDCQNLFCEVDKYSRVVHPEIAGVSGRRRIKQSYRVDPLPLTAWFPPKWGINDAGQGEPPSLSNEHSDRGDCRPDSSRAPRDTAQWRRG
jgi:hypothetical protein